MRRLTALMVTTALALSTLLGCASQPPKDPNAPTLNPGDTYNFLGEESAPIHLGDNDGSIADVQRFKKVHPETVYEGQSFGWWFKLSERTEGATLRVSIFSLAASGEVECPTLAIINGQEVVDLRTGSPVGSSIITHVQKSIPQTLLKTGDNYLQIREEWCKGGSWLNDSILIPKDKDNIGVELTLE